MNRVKDIQYYIEVKELTKAITHTRKSYLKFHPISLLAVDWLLSISEGGRLVGSLLSHVKSASS